MEITSQTFSGTVLWLAMCLCSLHSKQFGSYSLQPPLCTCVKMALKMVVGIMMVLDMMMVIMIMTINMIMD